MKFWHQIVAGMAVLLATGVVGAEPAGPIEFNRDVRPILSDHCFQCHGPDAAQRKGDLRLDVEPKSNGGHASVIVAGQPDKSELWRRVTSTDPDERMPPPGQGRESLGRGLTKNELATLRQWITSGGKFEKHWSLLPVCQPAPPQIQNSSFSIHNSLDPFIAHKLIATGLAQSPEASKPTLLRRVSFALTGLPPTLDDLEQYAGVPSSLPLALSPTLHLAPSQTPDWYERYVDKLLASPRYGERMAVPWLDAARYADTSGYQSDGERHMWRWRDWVLDALNANMPFDQFTIEQIAGDLLPGATRDQKIATGFNRNHRGNAEGGIIPEEYAVEYVADRVETTSTVWLGLTLGCCRCHDHKYDPFTQRDFYSLFAFFNNIPEKGRAIKIGNSPPFIAASTRQQADELQRLQRNSALDPRNFSEFFNAFRKWEQHHNGRAGDWYPPDDLIAHLPLNNDLQERVTAFSPASPAGAIDFTDGRLGRAARFEGSQWLEIPGVGDFGFFDKFSLSAWIYLEPGSGGTIVSHMVDEPDGEGYQLAIVDRKLQFNLSKRWLDDALRVETTNALKLNTWHHVIATYDGTRAAEGVRLVVDGQPQQLNILLDELNQTFATKQPLRIGGGGGLSARFYGAIDDVRVYARALSLEEARVLATPQTLDEIFAIEHVKRTPGQLDKLQFAFLEQQAPANIRLAYSTHKLSLRKLAQYKEQLPTVMVMEEMATPRTTHILLRGQYDKPGDRVQPNTPAELPPLSSTSSPTPEPRAPSPPANPNRFDLAKWLVSPENPLTSRVIVNRAWQLHFGTGLVKTAEDFGRQGEWPSHPDLLNHLAAEFQSNWNTKRLHRMIVTSATYRQSSEISDLGFMIGDLKSKNDASFNPKSPIPNHKSIDPDNRLLWHGPRLRISAEMVRDQALFVSGQLVEQLGGPSVKPLQPPGLWSELTGGDDYKPGEGADLVRRSMYTFWKRTIPPPTLSTFDSPTREACTVRDSRTNTPLQALALLNEPTFVDASRALANRIIHEAKTPQDRISRATIHILNRPPTPPELAILTAALNRNLQHHPTDEITVYTLLCTTLLNLDEAITSQ